MKKSFEEIKKEFSLIRYVWTDLGTMYYDPSLPREKLIIIKHLDGKLTPDFLPVYQNLYDAIVQWVNSKSSIKEFVYISAPLDVGADYIIRPFFIYHIAISDYLDKEDEDYVEPPKIFEKMRKSVSQELNNSSGEKNVIQNVIRKSLLESTDKTYFNYKMNKFIIVEPEISLSDLVDWKEKLNLIG